MAANMLPAAASIAKVLALFGEFDGDDDSFRIYFYEEYCIKYVFGGFVKSLLT